MIKCTDKCLATGNSMASLESYVEAGIDVFEFQNHISQWMQTKKPFPCMFIRSPAALYNNEKDILNFLDISEPTLPFLKETERGTKFELYSPLVIDGLTKMYSSSIQFIENLPDFWVEEASSL